MLAKFTGLKSPTFDDYISDLAVMFDMYPTKDDRQLHEVRKAMALIDDLEAVADKLPELPREKEVKDDTGESVDEVEKKEQHKVIDLQRKEN
ncbi:hypothetical protein QUW45_02395 [Limosilactobacillus pontis]|uniref:hypothetical protein n=1 Tax=Limosilactobacillus pontis TaxID=35787 RepID=UPI0025A33E70|nr:hypothetical protein [Limosilactobacillus pontis]MDM8331540.1 hypothetical protein [Limosilactobacillus pontis]